MFKFPFGRSRKTADDGVNPQFEHNGSPQYMPGVEPAGSARSGLKAPYERPGHADPGPSYVIPNHPAVVTPGFDDCGTPQAQLNYGLRAQPDVGGALNYAYENYELPLVQPAGAWMVAKAPFQPFGSPTMQAWPASIPTSVGGLIPGQFIAQPLLDPQGVGSGYDIYN